MSETLLQIRANQTKNKKDKRKRKCRVFRRLRGCYIYLPKGFTFVLQTQEIQNYLQLSYHLNIYNYC
jgi:hypothetical protein